MKKGFSGLAIAAAIAEVIRAFTPETPISVLQEYHDKLIKEAKK